MPKDGISRLALFKEGARGGDLEEYLRICEKMRVSAQKCADKDNVGMLQGYGDLPKFSSRATGWIGHRRLQRRFLTLYDEFGGVLISYEDLNAYSFKMGPEMG